VAIATWSAAREANSRAASPSPEVSSRQRRVAGMPAGDEDVRHARAVQGRVANSARQRTVGMRGVLTGNHRLKVAPVGF